MGLHLTRTVKSYDALTGTNRQAFLAGQREHVTIYRIEAQFCDGPLSDYWKEFLEIPGFDDYHLSWDSVVDKEDDVFCLVFEKKVIEPFTDLEMMEWHEAERIRQENRDKSEAQYQLVRAKSVGGCGMCGALTAEEAEAKCVGPDHGCPML